MKVDPPAPALPAAPPAPGSVRRILESDQLFGASREILIRHLGQEYRLQVTRSGKLILTK